jgi:hypothetical protein
MQFSGVVNVEGIVTGKTGLSVACKFWLLIKKGGVFACESGILLYLCSRAFRERVRKGCLTNLLLTI